MNFDHIIDRRGTHSAKWDMMQTFYGVSPDDGISMWVADMDFHPPACVQTAIDDYARHSVYGYYGDDAAYRDNICWWMQERHGWAVNPDHIFSTHGLVNGTAICIDAFSNPGDGVVLMTPVYYVFARVIKSADRHVVECELVNNNGRYEMDFEAWDAQMTGTEKLLILCSPHNPGGRVWSRSELQGVADFAKRHDLIIISDEIHHDLVYPGHHHLSMSLVDETIADRLVMMTATSKTFNIAGLHTGNVIIEDEVLRNRFAGRMAGLGMSPNALGVLAATAAYTADGANWVGELLKYLDTNRRLFDDGINAIPGLSSMALESTYLAWVDFSGTGMDMAEVNRRIAVSARIAANHGDTFGKGGETYRRFNIGTQRSRIIEAVERLRSAFADLQ